jgi:hypothetical protein
VTVVRLVEVAGPDRARHETGALVEAVVADWLPTAAAPTTGAAERP